MYNASLGTHVAQNGVHSFGFKNSMWLLLNKTDSKVHDHNIIMIWQTLDIIITSHTAHGTASILVSVNREKL